MTLKVIAQLLSLGGERYWEKEDISLHFALVRRPPSPKPESTSALSHAVQEAVNCTFLKRLELSNVTVKTASTECQRSHKPYCSSAETFRKDFRVKCESGQKHDHVLAFTSPVLCPKGTIIITFPCFFFFWCRNFACHACSVWKHT